MTHNPFAQHPKLPDVERGMLLGFPCPRCDLFTEKYLSTDGCYACTGCHMHATPGQFADASLRTAEIVNAPSLQ